MQNPDHQKSKCPKCHAGQGEPCRTVHGVVAEKVHYGRPEWSARADRKPCKLRGADVEMGFDLEEFTVLKDLWEREHLGDHPEDKDRPVLVPGTNICADCGENYQDPALTVRCEKRHALPRKRVA
jgi:hypothetical protein